MFETIKTKEEILNQDEILILNLFLYIEKNNEEKIISYIKNKSYKIWEKADENGFNILHKSCYLNNTSITKLIIQETRARLNYTLPFTSFINSKTDSGLTPLHYAAYKGNLEISKILIQNGADVNVVTNLGKNVIHLSAEGNQPSLMIFYLYKRIIDISSQDYNNSTPLHWACYAGAFDSIKFLISLNAEVNAIDKNELTPLHLATLYNRKNIVIKLLQNGAIKEMTNSRGETPLYLAWKEKYKDIFDILNEKKFCPLWSIKEPFIYVEPNNIYKKYIIIIFIIYEIFIILMILPFLKSTFDIIFNNILFVLNFTLFILVIKINPGYKKIDIINGINNNNNDLTYDKYPLMNLIENGIDIRNYCPKCFIPVVNDIKHCIICDKCVEGFSHHCFWINKCIGKKNKLIYLLFITITLIYALDSIYISLLPLLDFSYISYNKFIYKSIFNTLKERQIRVFFSALIIIFSIFICIPLFFLLSNELFKFFTIKNFCVKLKKKKTLDYIKKNFELETKNKIFDDDEDDENNIINNIGTSRETKDNTSKEIIIDENEIFSQGSKENLIPNPQTPFLNNNDNILSDVNSEG